MIKTNIDIVKVVALANTCFFLGLSLFAFSFGLEESDTVLMITGSISLILAIFHLLTILKQRWLIIIIQIIYILAFVVYLGFALFFIYDQIVSSSTKLVIGIIGISSTVITTSSYFFGYVFITSSPSYRKAMGQDVDTENTASDILDA